MINDVIQLSTFVPESFPCQGQQEIERPISQEVEEVYISLSISSHVDQSETGFFFQLLICFQAEIVLNQQVVGFFFFPFPLDDMTWRDTFWYFNNRY